MTTKKAEKARAIAERAAAKKSAAQQRHDEIMATPIAKAILPLRESAIDRAEQEARGYIDKKLEVLMLVDYDLDRAAPAPQRNLLHNRDVYNRMNKERSFYIGLCKSSGCCFPKGSPRIVEIDPNRVEAFVLRAKESAAAQYDAFITKMVKKIGPVRYARLEGNHIWSYSFLHVTTMAGERQIWKTQQIVNCSSLGTLFNQWPSRQVKVS